MKKRTFKNIAFLFINQILTYLFPLITLPILVKSLGAGGFGRISFAMAFISYFMLIVDFGFNITSSRKIACNKNNQEECYRIFITTIYSKLFLAAISGFVLLLLTSLFQVLKEDRFLIWTFYFSIWGLALFPQWYFQGIEKMGNITLINSISKIIYTLLIIFFIKGERDLVLVGFFYSLSYIFPGVLAFIIAYNEVFKSRNLIKKIVKFRDVLYELSEGKFVFLSTIMSSVLLSTSIFILGIFASKEIVGIYSAIDKLIKASVFIYTPITVAIFPIISNELMVSEKKGLNSILKFGIPTVLMSIIIMIVLIYIKDPLISKVYKPYFTDYSSIFVILSVWVPFSVVNNFIGIQYLCAGGHSKIYGNAFTISGVLTVILMLILTKEFSYNGTALSVLIGEVILTITMLIGIFLFKKHLKIDIA